MVTPYNDHRDKTEQVRDMFDNIAPAYDTLNRRMSFGLDRGWRRRAVRCVADTRPVDIIDIATGTGDFAISLAREIPACRVRGLDLSEKMVEIGRRKVTDAALDSRISLEVADCLHAPVAPASADAVTVAFGVRNFSDLSAGFRAMHRMLRPGGLLCVLELSTPVNPLVRPFYNIYTRAVIPRMGRKVSKDSRAYSYLPESIAAVPQADEMLALMRSAGFVQTAFRRLTFGVCTLYTAVTPHIQ